MNRLLTTTLAVAFATLLTGCAGLTLAESGASESAATAGNTGGDYEFLDCGTLAVIETQIRDRRRGDGAARLSVDQSLLMKSQLDEIVATRLIKECPTPRAALRDEAEANQGVALAPVIAASEGVPAATAAVVAAPAPKAPNSAPAQRASIRGGPYLQVGTFAIESGAEAAAAHFRGLGYGVRVDRFKVAGDTWSRVVVGPLTRRAMQKAMAEAEAFGLTDAYAINQ